MPRKAEPVDPWKSADPALAVTLEQLRWFRGAARRARIGNRASETLLLLTSAATTVAAALAVTPWVTALRYTGVWTEISSIVNQYRLLPDDRRDGAAQRSLLSSVDEIVTAETTTWATRRRKVHDHTQQGAP